MVDKGMALVVADKQYYLNRVQDLLADKDTYRAIPGETTSRQKHRLIQILRDIKVQGGINDLTYK